MKKLLNFEDLEVWQLAYQNFIDLRCYIIASQEFNQDYDLKRQLLRSSGSVMDNIAEGLGRGGNKELIHFLTIAKGSNEEARSQLFRAKALHYLDLDDYKLLNASFFKVTKSLGGFIRYLKQSDYKGAKFK